MHHRIIEIGIITVQDGKVTEEWSSLVNPETVISPFITGITGIRTEDVENAPTFATLAKTVYEKLEGKTFVAHNARFDYSFVKNELDRNGIGFNAQTLCTVRASRLLYPEERSHNLDSLIDRHGLACENRHRAADDAKALVEFLRKAKKEHGKKAFDAAIAKLLKTHVLPNNISEDMVSSLPETPGVYVFLAASGRPLYIGKSVNIKKRVQSHFSSDHSSGKELMMKQQIAKIDCIETGSELSALILESTMIKSQAPLYNRKLRRTSAQCVLKLVERDAYHVLEVRDGAELEATELASCFGVFTTKKSALRAIQDICDDYRLCPALLGLEKRPKGTACLPYHLKRCSGACIGEMHPDEHNALLLEALGSKRHDSWKFGGPIGITEQTPSGKVVHIVDRWTYLGEAKTDEEMHEALSHERLPDFQFDTYNILRSFIRKNSRTLRIRPLSLRA